MDDYNKEAGLRDYFGGRDNDESDFNSDSNSDDEDEVEDDDAAIKEALKISIIEIVPPTSSAGPILGSCQICLTDDINLYRTTFLCNHRYCAECIAAMVRNTANPSCPGCKKDEQSKTSANGHSGLAAMIPENAIGLIDPHFANLAPGVSALVKDSFIVPFIICAEQYGTEIRQCPRCGSVSIGSVNDEDNTCTRCYNKQCGMLYCASCDKCYHLGSRCAIIPGAEEIAKGCKQCPWCGSSIFHARDHGCHGVKCPKCNHSFCFICNRDFNKCHCDIYCSDKCHCMPCPECAPGKRCINCDERGCSVCNAPPRSKKITTVRRPRVEKPAHPRTRAPYLKRTRPQPKK